MKLTRQTLMNAEWHKKHPMPKNPTLEQRVRWHISHARQCGCRPMPAPIIIEIKKRGK
jgi:hypothetical protein